MLIRRGGSLQRPSHWGPHSSCEPCKGRQGQHQQQDRRRLRHTLRRSAAAGGDQIQQRLNIGVGHAVQTVEIADGIKLHIRHVLVVRLVRRQIRQRIEHRRNVGGGDLMITVPIARLEVGIDHRKQAGV